ncbi:MAG: hypothetical protein WA029_20505, partial [Anaerolineae bacterium]
TIHAPSGIRRVLWYTEVHMVKRNWFVLFVSVALLLSAVLPPALSLAPTPVSADFTIAPLGRRLLL